MVSTTEGLTKNSPMDVGAPGTLKNPSARKLLSRFLELLDVTQKTDVLIFGASKTKFKVI